MIFKILLVVKILGVKTKLKIHDDIYYDHVIRLTISYQQLAVPG